MSSNTICAKIIDLVHELNRLSQVYDTPDQQITFIQSKISFLVAEMTSINRENAFYDQIEKHGFRGVGFIQEKVVSKLEELCPSLCIICQEELQYKNAIVTDCEHYYCKTCWRQWMNTLGSNQCCPTCRNENPKVFHF